MYLRIACPGTEGEELSSSSHNHPSGVSCETLPSHISRLHVWISLHKHSSHRGCQRGLGTGSQMSVVLLRWGTVQSRQHETNSSSSSWSKRCMRTGGNVGGMLGTGIRSLRWRLTSEFRSGHSAANLPPAAKGCQGDKGALSYPHRVTHGTQAKDPYLFAPFYTFFLKCRLHHVCCLCLFTRTDVFLEAYCFKSTLSCLPRVP